MENILTDALLEIQHGLEDLSAADVDGEMHEPKEELNDSSERLEALHRYKLLSDNSRDIILFMRKDDGRILEANAAATKAYGYSREDLLDLTIHDLRAPASCALIDGQMARAEAEGILFETVHKRHDGSLFPVEVSSQCAVIAGTQTLISVVRDISERNQAIRTIESLAKFPDENPSPVMRASSDGTIIYANPSGAKLLSQWGCLVGQVFPDSCRSLIKEALRSENNHEIEVATGKTVYSLVLAPVAGMGYVNIYGRDITERKQTEDRILRQNVVLDAINRVHEEAIQCETTEDLGRACLDIIESITQSQFSFIGEIGPDGLFHDTAISDPGWELCTMYDQSGHRRSPGSSRHKVYTAGSFRKAGAFSQMILPSIRSALVSLLAIRL